LGEDTFQIRSPAIYRGGGGFDEDRYCPPILWDSCLDTRFCKADLEALSIRLAPMIRGSRLHAGGLRVRPSTMSEAKVTILVV